MVSKIIVGIDPDSERHGYAVYVDGALTVCATATTVEIIVNHLPALLRFGEVSFSVEDVCANNFVYARNKHANKEAQSKIAMGIGRCQNAQKELMRWLDHYRITYKLHKPQKGNWADNKDLFERLTGWTGRSNTDSRAAAYFGYLGVKA